MKRVEGSSRLVKIACWGNGPELRHASVQGSTGCGGVQESADPIVMIHPKKEASSPLDGQRFGEVIVPIVCRHKIPVHVVVGHLSDKGPAGGPKLSVQNLIPSRAGMVPGATCRFLSTSMQSDNDAQMRQARATPHCQDQRLQWRASDLVSLTAMARWRQSPLNTSCELKAVDVVQAPCRCVVGGVTSTSQGTVQPSQLQMIYKM